jgi:hypothetical protein
MSSSDMRPVVAPRLTWEKPKDSSLGTKQF